MSYSGMGIVEPSGPYVTVHKGWSVPFKTARVAGGSQILPNRPYSPPSTSLPSSEISGGKDYRRFEFVEYNAPGPPKDTKLRKLIGSHASKYGKRSRKPVYARKRSLQTQKETFTSDRLDASTNNDPESNHPLVVPILIGAATSLCSSEWPIDMQPRDFLLLQRYIITSSSRMYPTGLRLRFNPITSREFFQSAMSDDAMLAAVLYAGAVYLTLLQGQTESWDLMYHKTQTISLVNKRLRDSSLEIDDSTIGAVSCLALGEAIIGHRRAWDMHMRGLQQMLLKRRKLDPLSLVLQIKLQRTDISGAIDYAAMPHLQFERSKKPSIWLALPTGRLHTIQIDLTHILARCGVQQELITVMTELAYFAAALYSSRSRDSVPVDPKAFVEDMYTIECRLLTFPTKNDDAFHDIDEACRLGGLLYMKAILEEFPHSKTGPSVLLGKLKEALHKIPKEEASSPLLLWLSIIGAMFSKFNNREYFICALTELISVTRVYSFKDDNMALGKVLPLEMLFGVSLDKLLRNVLAVEGSGTTQEPTRH